MGLLSAQPRLGAADAVAEGVGHAHERSVEPPGQPDAVN
jgi:hypothetical protein